MTLRAALAAALALVGLALVAPLAPAAAAAASDPAYPPHTCPTLSVSTTHPAVGEQITVTGQQFDADTRVSLTMTAPTYDVGTARTDADGNFSAHVRMPAGVTGNKIITVKGGQSVCPADPIQLFIEDRTTGNGGPGGGGGGGGTPAMTGVDIGVLVLVAGGLIGLGLLLNRRRSGARRRRRSAVS
jgi:hypothetical protein